MYWNFSFSISPQSQYSGLISFRIDWIDLLEGHSTLKSLLQHHSLKATILLGSIFIMVQLSHLYMTTGKTTALTTQMFVGYVMSLVSNMLSSFPFKKQVILISWLQSPSTVIFGSKKIKSATTYTFSPFICHEVIGPVAMILVFLMLQNIKQNAHVTTNSFLGPKILLWLSYDIHKARVLRQFFYSSCSFFTIFFFFLQLCIIWFCFCYFYCYTITADLDNLSKFCAFRHYFSYFQVGKFLF